MNEPGGIWPGAGRGPLGANDVTGSPQSGAGGRAVFGGVGGRRRAARGGDELPESQALSADEQAATAAVQALDRAHRYSCSRWAIPRRAANAATSPATSSTQAQHEQREPGVGEVVGELGRLLRQPGAAVSKANAGLAAPCPVAIATAWSYFPPSSAERTAAWRAR